MKKILLFTMANLLALSGLIPSRAEASILKPLLLLLAPRLESSLQQECTKLISGVEPELIKPMAKVCKTISKPIASCLINQADTSGRALGVIKEMIQGKFGDDSELVVKRCIASILLLPLDTFSDVPLKKFIDQLKETSKPVELPFAGMQQE